MTKFLRSVHVLIFVISAALSSAQVGTEFWLAPPEATSGHVADTPILLRLASGNAAATVTISMPALPSFNGGSPIVVNMAANSASSVTLTSFVNQLETRPMDAVLNTGLKVVSTAPITCYYEINTGFNPDIWALKGPNSLGTEFYTPFQRRWANGNYTPTAYTSFDIVATENNTTVIIYPTRALFGGHPAYQSYSITLNAGQTYSGGVISTNADNNPSGSVIVSNKPIAVSTKDDSVQHPGGCRDMNGDQLVPVDIAGKEYIVVRGGLTGGNEYAYVVATQNNTELFVDGTYVTTLFNGQSHEVHVNTATKFIETSKPTLVTHMSGFGCETGTALLPPLNCAGSDQVFFTRSTTETFILTILVRDGAQGGFQLNGNPALVPASAFNVVPNTGGAWRYAFITFTTGQIPINTSQLLTNSIDVFSLGIINGGASSGCRYGYFSEFASEIFVDAGSNQVVCANDTVQLAGSVTGGASQGIWTTSGSGIFIPNASDLNAKYLYSLDDIANTSVTLTLTSVSNCFPVEDEVTITIPPAPIVLAGNTISACKNNPTATLNGSVIFAAGGLWSGGGGTFFPNNTTLNATYTPSAAELTAGTVTLTLTSIGNGTCYPEFATVTINYTPAPIVNAGTNQTVCSNVASILLNGSVTGATGGLWGGGFGVFDPAPNALNVSYFPTAAERSSGSINLTLTSTGNGNCLPEEDVMTITFTPAPVVNAGFDQFVCSNNAAVTLNGSVTIATGGIWSGGLGVFTPSNTSLTASYTPAASEITNGQVTLTLTSTGNGGCVPVTDQMTIFIGPGPAVNAGPNQTVCANNAAVTLSGSVINAGGGQWSGGGGTYTPGSTSLSATYTPSAGEISAGSVTLTLTSTGNGSCVAESDEIIITITPGPTANAGVNQSVCANNPNVTLAGSFTIATGAVWTGGLGSFSPNANAVNAVYTPSAGEIILGSVNLTLTTTGNGTCLAATDVMTITITPSPVVNAGVDQSVCANNSAVTLTGSVTIASGGTWTGGLGTFVPNNNTLGAVYTPSASEVAAGSVTLTLTSTGNGTCTAVTDLMTITIGPAPIVNAGANQSVCANNAQVSLAGSVINAGGGTWTGGAGIFFPNANTVNALYTPTAAEITAGTVVLTLTSTGNGNCIAVADDMTITITPAPVVNAGPDVSVCANNASLNLSGSVTVASGGIWTGGTGNFNPSPTALNVTYTPTAAEIASGTITLTLTSTGNGTCLAVSDTRVITFTPAPTANAGANQTVCANNSTVTLNGSVTIATGGSWSGGLGIFAPNANTLNATYTPTATEIANGGVTLTLTTTGNGGCLPTTSTMTITIGPAPIVSAGANQSICANNAVVTLNGTVTNAGGGTWSGGSGTYFPSANSLSAAYTPTAGEIASGSLTLTLTSTGNGLCNAVTSQTTISFTPAPVVNAGADVSVCSNNAAVTLNGTVTVASGGIWTGGSGTYVPSASALNVTYTPTAAEISSGSITLTLTSTGNGNCSPVSDTRIITFTPSPTANAGANQNVCANNAIVSLAGSVSVATGGSWSGGLGIFTPNANTLNATYTPTAADIANGSITLTLTTTGNGGCNAVTDVMTINIGPAPIVNAGANQSVCSNNAVINLNGSVVNAGGGTWSGGAGTFFPSASFLSAAYTPTAGEIASGSLTLTLTSTANGLCNPVSDDVVITFTPAPVVNAGANISVCSNNAAVSLNGTVSIATGGIWTGGSGTFVPSNTALNATYTPTASEISAGTLTLTLTSTGNGTCNAVSDARVITFTPSPTADAGANQSVCANNAVVTLAGAITVASGGTWSGGLGIFSPDANTLNATYTPTASDIAIGSISLTLTTTGNGGCIAATDVMTISISPAPIVNAGANQTACANNAVISLAGSVTNAGGGTWTGGAGTYFPSVNSISAAYTPTAAEIASGTLTLTLTSTSNGLCNAVSDDVTITFTPAPVVNAGADVSVCSNNAVVTLNGTVTVASGGIWTGGSGTFVPSNTALNVTYTPTAAEISSGSLTLTLTSTGNGTCNPVSDTRVITFTPSPTADAGANQNVCANNAVVNLAGSVTVATGGTWSGGLGIFTPNANTLNATYTPTASDIANGSITLTLTTTGNGGCNAATDVMTINIGPAPIVNAGANQSVCANNAVINLNGSVTNAGGGTWSGGSGTFFPSANFLSAAYTPSAGEIASGSLTLTLTSTANGLCNAVSDDVIITFTPAPVVNAGLDVSVCSNNAVVTLNGTVSVATGGIWTGGSGTFVPSNTALNVTYTPTAAEISFGSLTLTLTSTGNGTCNSVSDTRVITFTPSPTADAGANITVCANNANVTLAGVVTVASGGTWSGGLGVFSPNANTLNAVYTPSATEINNGSVSLTLTTTGNAGCLPASDVMTINIGPAPTANAGANQTLCANNALVTLNGSVTNAGGGIWSGGAGTYFPGASSLSAAYTPTAGEIASGTLILTLTTTGNGLCNPVTSQTTITFTPAPVVNAGPDASYCANNAIVILNGTVNGATGGTWTGGSGTFDPSANALNVTYFPTAAELSSGSITLTLTSTGNGNCLAVADTKVITFTPAPTANAGFDAFVCANNANVTLGGSVTIATGGNWSGGLGIFTPNNTTLNAVYTPAASEISSGLVNLTLTTTGNGGCNPVSDVMSIFIGPGPVANAGPDQTVCQNNPAVTLAGSIVNAGGGIWSGGAGTFLPNNTSLIVIYTPTPAEAAAGSLNLTLTSTGNGNCNPVSDVITLNFTPSPTANAGVNQVLCFNNPVATLNGIVTIATGGTWTGGLGIFTPNNTTLNATYTPTAGELASGFVNLTLTTTGNGLCNSVNDVMQITFTPAPIVNAGADLDACSNNPSVILNGSVTIASGGIWSGGLGSFAPNAATLSATYTPTQTEINAGFVTLTLTSTGNGNCVSVSDVMTINFTPSPTANAGADQSVCSNNAAISLAGSVTIATGGMWSGGAGTYAPNANALNAVYTPTAGEIASGTLSLTLTTTGNGNCNAVTDVVVITFTPSPTANAGASQSVCNNNAIVTLNGGVTVATGGVWSGGAGSFAPNANTLNAIYTASAGEITAGTVTLTLTTTGNGNCNAVTSTMTITITPGPTANAGADANVCSNNAVIQLNGAVTIATGGVWTGGLGLFTPNASALNATYTPTAGEIASGSLTLTLTTTGNAPCTASTDEVTFTFTPSPTSNAGNDRIVCANNASVVLEGSVTVASGGIWSGGAGAFVPNNTTLNATYTPTASEILNGAVTLTLTTTGNGNCNAATNTMNIIITAAPVVNAGVNQTVCGNNANVTLNGSVFIANGGIWSGGAGTFAPSATALNAVYTPSAGEIATGTVTLTLTTTGNGLCMPETDTMVITITPATIANAGANQTLCANNASIILNGSVIVATGGTWSGGNGTFVPNANTLTATYNPTQNEINSGTLSLTLTTTGNGLCLPATDVVDFIFTPAPVVNAGGNVTVCGNNAAVALGGTVTIATGGIWSGGSGTYIPNATTLNATYNPSAAEIAAGTVTLTLTSTGNGTCIAVTATKTITITPAPTANAGANVTVCANSPVVTLNGNISIATGGIWSGGSGVFNPNNTTLNATYTPSAGEIAAGTVSLTLTTTGNGLCLPVTSIRVITITPAPVVNAGRIKLFVKTMLLQL
jgi:hypothetical protein